MKSLHMKVDTTDLWHAIDCYCEDRKVLKMRSHLAVSEALVDKQIELLVNNVADAVAKKLGLTPAEEVL